MDSLIDRLNERAHDPKRATDEGHGFRDEKGRPIVFVAAPPATEQQIADAEQRLGFRLPPLLCQVYQEVGDGGFGPGYGLYGLSTEGGRESLVKHYGMLRQAQTSPPWPMGLVPICDWGCGIASYLDCSLPEAPVVRLDPNMPKGDVAERVPEEMHYGRAAQVEGACWVERPSFEEWLMAWADGQPLFYAAYGEAGEEVDDDEDEADE